MKRLLALIILIAALAVASFGSVTFSPSSQNFGSQTVGTTSAVQFVTFSNTSSTSLTFGTESIAGDYNWGGVGTCGPTLAAGANCTMSLVFKPTASGTRTGSLTVSDSASTSAHIISLTGTGITSSVSIAPTTTTSTATSTGSATLSSGYSALVQANYTSNANYTSTYYVSASGSDSNPGTSSAPWATIAHAASSVSGCALVLVEPGTYTVSSGRTAKITNSGTSGCHTAYVATTYSGSILNTANNYANDPAIWITGSYVDLVGFDINNPMGCMGVYSNGSSINITYNRIHDVDTGSGAYGCGNGVGGGGILGSIGSSTYNNWSNNTLWNVGIVGNHFIHGLYTTSAHNTLQNNIVYAAGGACIQAFHEPSYDVITNNTLVGCGYNGFLFGADPGYSYSNSVFSNNAMSGNSGYDIDACGASGCGVAIGSGNTFSNNDTNSSGGNSTGDLSSVGQALMNNITSAPNFVKVASPASGGNFDVNSGSPLITGGTANNAPKTDIVGAARNTADPSIGAYEN
jgi:Pel9A-like, right handed beta helix region